MTRWDSAMGAALAEAELAPSHRDVPVGAVVIDPAGTIIAVAHNERELHHDPSAHAEVVALRRAAEVRASWRLDDCTLVVTLEPCVMCAGAITAARISRLVFGAFDDKAGAVSSLFDVVRDPRLNHRVDVVAGVRAKESSALLRQFFRTPTAEG